MQFCFLYIILKDTQDRNEQDPSAQRAASSVPAEESQKPLGGAGALATQQSPRRAVVWMISIKIHNAKGSEENKDQLGMCPRQLGQKYPGGAQRLLLRSPLKPNRDGWFYDDFS